MAPNDCQIARGQGIHIDPRQRLWSLKKEIHYESSQAKKFRKIGVGAKMKTSTRMWTEKILKGDAPGTIIPSFCQAFAGEKEVGAREGDPSPVFHSVSKPDRKLL
jgi:hypothetical protein